MKRTKIRYRVLQDGKIFIESIENALNMQEMQRKFGTEIAETYFANIPHFVGCKSIKGQCEVLIRLQTCSIYTYKLTAGEILISEDFSKAIAGMKKAGNALGKIKKHEKESKIQEILI